MQIAPSRNNQMLTRSSSAFQRARISSSCSCSSLRPRAVRGRRASGVAQRGTSERRRSPLAPAPPPPPRRLLAGRLSGIACCGTLASFRGLPDEPKAWRGVPTEARRRAERGRGCASSEIRAALDTLVALECVAGDPDRRRLPPPAAGEALRRLGVRLFDAPAALRAWAGARNGTGAVAASLFCRVDICASLEASCALSDSSWESRLEPPVAPPPSPAAAPSIPAIRLLGCHEHGAPSRSKHLAREVAQQLEEIRHSHASSTAVLTVIKKSKALVLRRT
eukprot:SAG25_NODE_356_length_9202_cov_4.367791_7_plen_279_part_00